MKGMKLKKGDHVMVVSGKDKGKTGKIERVLRDEWKVVVEGVALAKHHNKGVRGQIGQIIEKPRAISASNVMFVEPESKKPTRIGREVRDGKRVRVTVKGKKVLS
jgi:large subunit ribosomal protein L24